VGWAEMTPSEAVAAMELLEALWPTRRPSPTLTDAQERELYAMTEHVSASEWSTALRRLAQSGDFPTYRPGCAVIWEALRAVARYRVPAAAPPGPKAATTDQARSAIATARAALARSA
jgi:hypothetical protein